MQDIQIPSIAENIFAIFRYSTFVAVEYDEIMHSKKQNVYRALHMIYYVGVQYGASVKYHQCSVQCLRD